MAQRKKPKIVYIDQGVDEAEAIVEREAKPAVVEPVVAPSVRPETPNRRFKRPSIVLWILMGVIVASVCVAFVLIPAKQPTASQLEPAEAVKPPKPIACLGIAPDVDWGHGQDSLECQTGAFEDGQTIGDVLTAHNVDYRLILKVMDLAERKQMPRIRLGSKYYVIYSPKIPQRPVMFVYEPDAASYVFMNLDGAPEVYLHSRAVVAKDHGKTKVIIKTTLADEMFNMESGLLLARKLEAAIKWKVDLFHLDVGDQFLLLYDETQYEGNLREIGDLQAISYRLNGTQAYAFYFKDDFAAGFYDFDGRPMKSGFLMAPIEFGRISSGYDVNRIDPIKRNGEIRAHLGTDYAAPLGTPILAVGDGTVMNAENKGGNGNYVKLFHSDSIQTQYLHMSAFAEGIAPGVAVRQGQVIGYVGSTGRSTGPHVCFRYWKNGVQVDHRKELNFGVSVGLQGESLDRFHVRRDSLMGLITEI